MEVLEIMWDFHIIIVGELLALVSGFVNRDCRHESIRQKPSRLKRDVITRSVVIIWDAMPKRVMDKDLVQTQTFKWTSMG